LSKLDNLLALIDNIKDKINDKQYIEIMNELKEVNKDTGEYCKLTYDIVYNISFGFCDDDCEYVNEIKTFQKQNITIYLKVLDTDETEGSNNIIKTALKKGVINKLDIERMIEYNLNQMINLHSLNDIGANDIIFIKSFEKC
jgi:hypothetical protein